jgi:beta-galactosidase
MPRLPRLLAWILFVLGAVAALHAQPAVQSLAGEWRFALDRADAGVSEAWFNRDLPDRITLPGVLQSQGYGNDIATDTPWVVALGDAWWKLQSPELVEKFSQPGRVEVPFLSQPPKHYLGAAWYQRDIEIPANWSGRRIGLFLERTRWETTVWIDGQKLGSNNSLVAPHEYELGRLTPGKHRLTIRIDNRQIVRDPRNDGHGVDSHAISDALGSTWNGIVGRIELQATTPVWIHDAQVFPNVQKKTARIKVTLGNASGAAGTGIIRAGSNSAPIKWDEYGGWAELDVPLDPNAQTWDEFKPALHSLTVSLKGPGADDSRKVTFGLREITWNDKDLIINGRVVNMRTTHSGGDFPLTGYPATDVESWKKIIRACQAHGLNGIRFHSWCPPEAAFIAADELGFYLQPELGLWVPFNPGSPYTLYMNEETPRLLRAYGNHPSFVLFAPSNEPAGNYEQVTPQWAKEWHQKDPRRLYSAGTGWFRRGQVEGGAQFAVLVRYGKDPRNMAELRNQPGWFGNDYRAALTDVHIPVLAHENGQWCSYPDFDVIKKFTGYMRPSNYNIFRHIAEQNGVLEYNTAFAHASGRFQLMCYKEEIEANLRTPGLAGFQLLDLHDYLGQGTALIGLLDAFWESKGYVTPEEFRRFSGATVPLARLKQRTFTTAETLTADVELYHFGAKPVIEAAPYWEVVDASGLTVAAGDFPPRALPVGKNIPLGQVSLALKSLPAPAAYKLVVSFKGAPDASNDWNFWVYPAEIPAAAPDDILITSNWADAEARLAAGGKVLFTPGSSALDPKRSPPMKRVPVFWNIQMTVRPPRNPEPRFDAMLGLLIEPAHAALAQFPTEAACDWQWTPLIDNVRSVNLTGAPRELKPIVAAIDDWNRNWRLGVIFECSVAAGKLLVSAIPLEGNAPGTRQLRQSLLDYAASAKFKPAASLDIDQVRALWISSGTNGTKPAERAFDPDLDDGTKRPVAKP